MTGDEYRVRAVEFHTRAIAETNTWTRAQLLTLAQSYLRLAEQADRNAQLDVVYETPPPTDRSSHQQQQQQQQQQSKLDGE
jgi:hypothetical protein